MSKTAYAPYEPLDTLKAIAPEVWIVDGPEIGFGACGVFPFPTRMTVIRLLGGRLWLHSPTPPAEALLAAITALGEPRFLIAPNTLHYWWIPEWASRFPQATVYAAPGLDRKAKRPLRIDQVLGETAPQPWAGVIDQVVMASRALTEIGFFHRPSRTLMLTDMIENFEPARIRPWFYRKLVQFAGAADPDGRAPLDLRLTFRPRRAALTVAVKRMIAWQPERVIVAHGRYYQHDGVAELRRAFRWAL